ncbi:sensor histidine kinase [Haloferula sp. BvORR071]|uniref:sensor histidine kinase n=1 Tax=Haloferula sp. BvORR071 TaxID=1396141 RepID=UPI00054F7748|nr:sensor histidine kinase [Haloferula sp. BvORR071]
MPFPRSLTWQPPALLLVLAAALSGWLLLGFAGRHEGMRPLAGWDGGEVAVLQEKAPAGDATAAEIAALPETAWLPWGKPGFIREHGEGSAWVRITLRNPGAAPQSGVLMDAARYADHVDFFSPLDPARDPHPEGAGAWLQQVSGEWVPTADKAIRGRETAFPLVLPPHGSRVIYLHYQDAIALWLEPGWWRDAGDFHAAMQRDLIAESFYFGTLLALLLYHFIVWLRLRFPATGYYLLYLAFYILQLFGTRSGVLVLGRPLGSPWMETIGAMSLPLSGAFLAAFARHFLELPDRAPRADRTVRGAGYLLGGLAVLALLAVVSGHAYLLNLIVAIGGLAHIALLGAGVVVWRSGGWEARYFVLLSGLLLAGLVPLVVLMRDAPFETVCRVVMLGSALEILALSLALGERFARLQREKLAAQALAVEEAERRHQIQEAYADELEHEVRSRTRELMAADADKDRMLTVLGHDLRSPLTALTLSAEQEAVAVRPDFAAEVAQTGRALLLLLEDVLLWTRLRAGTVRVMEHAAESVVRPMVELHRSGAAGREVGLLLEMAEDARVKTDLVLAQTLVRNLVSNAVKSARHRVSVKVTATDFVRISVRDDGPGLPEAVMASLRDPAVPLPLGNARSGLGLRLCLEITQALDTSLESGTPDGGGTEISFTLPRAET